VTDQDEGRGEARRRAGGVGRDRVAIAGVVAGAVVGIAGLSVSWLVARDDQASQRSLAHEARVYDRRANAYVDALRYLQSTQSKLAEAADALFNEQKPHLNREMTPPALRASLAAYASSTASHAFDLAAEKGHDASDLVFVVESASGSEREADLSRFNYARDRFGSALTKFQKLVHREIG
jgi:hypothetical protein